MFEIENGRKGKRVKGDARRCDQTYVKSTGNLKLGWVTQKTCVCRGKTIKTVLETTLTISRKPYPSIVFVLRSSESDTGTITATQFFWSRNCQAVYFTIISTMIFFSFFTGARIRREKKIKNTQNVLRHSISGRTRPRPLNAGNELSLSCVDHVGACAFIYVWVKIYAL